MRWSMVRGWHSDDVQWCSEDNDISDNDVIPLMHDLYT